VNTRFDVHEEPGRDILTTMRLWQLHQPVLTTTHN
jgi:hypothetical protein